MQISHESTYQTLFVKDLAVLAPGAHRLLRTGRPRRRARHTAEPNDVAKTRTWS
jgi:hypothetical protein